mgnify:CR=1 FL=1
MLYGRIVTGTAFRLLQSVYASTCDKSLVAEIDSFSSQDPDISEAVPTHADSNSDYVLHHHLASHVEEASDE